MSSIKGIKAGTTNIVSSYLDVDNKNDSQQLEVVQVSLDSIDNINDVTYTGSECEPVPTVYAYVGNGDGTKTQLVRGTDYTLEYSNNINVGTATVTATGINNFTGTISGTFEITSATIVVSKEDQSYVYNGISQGVGISVTTKGNQEATIRYRTSDSGEYNLTTAPQKIHVSESGIIYYQVSAPYHTTVEGSYQLNITGYTASLEWGDTSWIYDEMEHSTTCIVTNLIGDDSCTVILENNSITDSGTVIVTATGLSNNDYILPSSGVTQTLTVIPGLFVKVSGLWTPVKKVYKKISGSWILQEISGTFDSEKLYMERE